MPFLIDGYNLLHAMGALADPAAPGELERARRKLLNRLRAAHGERDAASVTVVFDAARAPAGARQVGTYRGIRVYFAVAQPEADDLIEELIQRDATPHRLTVVSNDHRIQTAARRRRCPVLGCSDYLDWLDRQRKPRPRAQGPDKPETLSEGETALWLQEFADLSQDPALREISDPPEFLDPIDE